jgi:hypothetical protein
MRPDERQAGWQPMPLAKLQRVGNALWRVGARGRPADGLQLWRVVRQ